jgi:hypothetical protein
MEPPRPDFTAAYLAEALRRLAGLVIAVKVVTLDNPATPTRRPGLEHTSEPSPGRHRYSQVSE